MNSADLVSFLMRPSGIRRMEVKTHRSSRKFASDGGGPPRVCVICDSATSVHSIQSHKPSVFNKEGP